MNTVSKKQRFLIALLFAGSYGSFY